MNQMTLTNSKFLVYAYLILGFTGLLDAAEGTKMVQARLDTLQRDANSIAVSNLLIEYLRNRKKRLLGIFLLNNFAIILAFSFSLTEFESTVNTELFLVLAWANSTIFLASFVAKFFLALKKIRLLLAIQASAVSIQLVIQVFVNLFFPGSVVLCVFNYSTASLIVIITSYLYVRNLNKTSESLERFEMSPLYSAGNFKLTVKLQSTQLLQMTYLLLLPVMAIRVLDDADFVSFGLLYKIFLTFVTALSTNIALIWIESFTKKHLQNKSDQIILILWQDLRSCFLPTFISLFLIATLSLSWNSVFSFPQIESFFLWLNFLIFVNLQIVVWRRYYASMGKKSYLRILLATITQNVALLISNAFETSNADLSVFLIINMPLIFSYLILLSSFVSSRENRH
jgi:hypothetical protein